MFAVKKEEIMVLFFLFYPREEAFTKSPEILHTKATGAFEFSAGIKLVYVCVSSQHTLTQIK
jgi:hypothetical protein